MLKGWRQTLYKEGIRIRVGRWNIQSRPIVVLVDFTSLFSQKDAILATLWENYRVDSISGQWDYVEPVLFGYAAGMVIASYAENFCSSTDKVAAHFHEWMTAAGGLYLRSKSPYVATLFTTHATVMGRCIAGNRLPLYNDLAKFNADELARQFNVTAKHSIEKAAATYHDVFLTVSDITANECKFLLGREVDGVTPNGFENDFVWTGAEYDKRRTEARRAMIAVAEACLGRKYDAEPLIVGTSGRYEFHNKGPDLFSNRSSCWPHPARSNATCWSTSPCLQPTRARARICRPIWPTPRSRSIRRNTGFRPTVSNVRPKTRSSVRSRAASLRRTIRA